MKTVSDAQIAPDGKTVAYVVGAWDFKENLLDTDVWLADVATGAARKLTASPKRDERPRFARDGKTIAFLSERRLDEKDGKETRQIWLIAPNGGEASRLDEPRLARFHVRVEPGREADRLHGRRPARRRREEDGARRRTTRTSSTATT